MAEEAVGQPSNKQDPVGGGQDSAPASEPFKTFATEEDFTAFISKKTEVYERKLTQLRKEMDSLKAATRSTDEQAAELARQQAEEAHKRDLEAVERRSDVKAVLMSRGLSRDLAVMLSKEAGDDWADPTEAADDLIKRYGVPLNNKQTQPVAGGGGRNPSGHDVQPMTPEYVSEMMAKHGSGWYTPERRKQADEWRAANTARGPRRLGT